MISFFSPGVAWTCGYCIATEYEWSFLKESRKKRKRTKKRRTDCNDRSRTFFLTARPPPYSFLSALHRLHSFTKMKLKEDLNPMLLLLFHLMVWIYTFITFLPSYILSWVSTPDGGFYGSEEERAKRAKARPLLGRPEGPYRAVNAAKRLVTSLHPGADTLDKMFEYAATRFPHRDCLGTREVISEEDERQDNGKVFKKVMSDAGSLLL